MLKDRFYCMLCLQYLTFQMIWITVCLVWDNFFPYVCIKSLLYFETNFLNVIWICHEIFVIVNAILTLVVPLHSVFAMHVRCIDITCCIYIFTGNSHLCALKNIQPDNCLVSCSAFLSFWTTRVFGLARCWLGALLALAHSLRVREIAQIVQIL